MNLKRFFKTSFKKQFIKTIFTFFKDKILFENSNMKNSFSFLFFLFSFYIFNFYSKHCINKNIKKFEKFTFLC